MCLLWPMTTPGRPGRLTPLTSYPGAVTATWNQADAIGSGTGTTPASIAPPPATLSPFTAQPLPPAQGLPACPYGRSRVSARTEAAARATAAGGWFAALALATPVPRACPCPVPLIVFVGPAPNDGPAASGTIPRAR